MSGTSARRLLCVIVGAYIVLALAYAWATPPWQNPDEPAHYNYARFIAEHGRLPVLEPGDYDQAALEQLKASKFAGNPDISGVRYESYQPPLYYLLASILIALTPGTELDLYAMRLLSIAGGALILIVTFAIGRAIVPDDPLVALTSATVIAFIPQHIAMTAAANNDTLGELILGLMALLAVARVKGLPGRQFTVAGGVLLGLALLTKVTAYIGGLLLIMGELANWWLTRSQGENDHRSGVASSSVTLPVRSHLAVVATMLAVAMVISGWWFARNALVYGGGDLLGLARHDQVVVGQPRTVLGAEAIRHFVVVTFQSFWAVFGWMGVLVDVRIYWLLAALTVIALVGLAIFLWRRLDMLWAWQRWSLALLAVQLGLVFAIMIGLNLIFIQPQGRYLFPASAAIGVFLSLGLREAAHPRVLVTLTMLGSAVLFFMGQGAIFVILGGLITTLILAACQIAWRIYRALLWTGLVAGLIVLDVVCLVMFIVPALSAG